MVSQVLDANNSFDSVSVNISSEMHDPAIHFGPVGESVIGSYGGNIVRVPNILIAFQSGEYNERRLPRHTTLAGCRSATHCHVLAYFEVLRFHQCFLALSESMWGARIRSVEYEQVTETGKQRSVKKYDKEKCLASTLNHGICLL